jgi:hypothetical protein
MEALIRNMEALIRNMEALIRNIFIYGVCGSRGRDIFAKKPIKTRFLTIYVMDHPSP